jgi:hypothetical protein
VAVVCIRQALRTGGSRDGFSNGQRNQKTPACATSAASGPRVVNNGLGGDNWRNSRSRIIFMVGLGRHRNGQRCHLFYPDKVKSASSFHDRPPPERSLSIFGLLLMAAPNATELTAEFLVLVPVHVLMLKANNFICAFRGQHQPQSCPAPPESTKIRVEP